jgi:hypothetical protein
MCAAPRRSRWSPAPNPDFSADADARRVLSLAREASARLWRLRRLRRMVVEEEITIEDFVQKRDALLRDDEPEGDY